MHSESFFHFAQNLSYGYLNFTHTNHMLLSQAGEYPRVMRKKWLGSVACPVKMLEGRTISELRYPEMKNYGKRVNNGGWHFSYCGGRSQNLENRVRHKIINNAHQEFNNEIVHSQINEAFTLKRDLLGRREPRKLFPGMKEPKFKVQDLSELPDFISQNSAKLNHLIFPQ